MNNFKNIGYKNIFLAFAILVIGIITTILLTYYYINDLKKSVQYEYEKDCNEIANKINSKLNEHSLILLSGTAFFASSNEITRAEWKKYNEQYIKNNLMNGVQGLGFSKIIMPNELQSHIDLVRKEGFSNYSIKPSGQRDIYTSILFLEPNDERNKRAFGYDMFSEPVRRHAMEISRDLKKVTLTGKVTLVQENDDDIQSGILMYAPIYQNGLELNTTEQRRNAIIGWVYSPFRMNDLINGILKDITYIQTKNLHLEIYEYKKDINLKNGKKYLKSKNLLFSNQIQDSSKHISNHENYIYKTLELYNQKWTLVFSHTSDTNLLFKKEALFIFISGILISFLITGLFLSVSRTQANAEQIADNLTNILKANNEKLETINNELNASKIAAEKSEENLKNIMNLIPDLVWIKDINGVYLDCNKRFEDFFGTTKDNIIGKTDYDYVNKELADFFKIKDTEALKTDNKTIFEELITFNNDGHQELLETIKTPIYHKDGTLIGILGIGRNISERKKYQEEIENKNKELIENNAAKDKLFSIVAHDLKSPFNGFLGLTKMMSENAEIFTHEEKTEMFFEMRKSAENMYSLLENLLEWSRIQRGTISFNPEKVMLRYVVEQNLDILRNPAKQKNIKFNVIMPFDYELLADVQSINTIFRNLISNAIKFTNIGGEIEVGIIENEQKNDVQKATIYVKDNGIGMNEDMVTKLFKLDQDVSRRGTVGESSTGLGLLLCSDFVKKHNGKIWVESQENLGTTFYFTLG